MRAVAVTLIALLFAGCGGDDADQQTPETRPSTERAVPATTAPDTARSDTAPTGAAEFAAGDGQRGAAAGPAPGASGRDGRLYTVQVAAFLEGGSADRWVGRLRRQGWPVWSSVSEVEGRTFHRVRIGAVPTVDEVRRLGAIVTDRYEWPVWLAPVTSSDRMPADAVEATRRLLDRG